MSVTIAIVGMSAEQALIELLAFANKIGPMSVPAHTVEEIMEKAAEVRAAIPEPEEPKAKRGRPKKEPEAQAAPANDEKPTMTAAQAEDFLKGSKLPPDEAPVEPAYELKDCVAAMRGVMDKFGYDAIRDLLGKFKVPKVSMLQPEQYGEFIKVANGWEAAKAAE